VKVRDFESKWKLGKTKKREKNERVIRILNLNKNIY
jgi:hypothetical protein